MICTQLCPVLLRVRIGDSWRCSEEIVNNLDLRLSMQSLLIINIIIKLGVNTCFPHTGRTSDLNIVMLVITSQVPGIIGSVHCDFVR